MGRTEALTSPANPLLKDVRRAISRGGLTEQGYMVAETFHLLEEALRSDLDIKVILAAESVQSTVRAHVRRLAGIRIAVVDDGVFQKLADTESSQGVITLANPPTWTLEQTLRGQTLAVGGFRDILGLTRKSLIPLLEYLDARKKTRRLGDVRVVE